MDKVSFIFSIVSAAMLLSVSCSGKEDSAPAEVSSVIMEKSRVSVVRGSTAQLGVIVLPDDAVYDRIEWSSNTPETVIVDENGTVTGVAVGSAAVRATIGDIYGECVVEVLPVGVSTLTVSPESVSLQEGNTAQLNVSILPEDADDVEVLWYSLDPGTASVDDNGLVTGVSTGNTEVMVSAGGLTASCAVTVTGTPVSSIDLNETELSLDAGETFQIVAQVMPENAYDKTVVWTSSDNAVASVSPDGLVTGVSSGNAVITASAGDVSAKCSVTVTGEINVGDWYYSDGTVSADLDPSRTVIGIVFWTGNPTADDAALAKEHPGCVHGLVMAVSGEETSKWQSAYQSFGGFVGDWVTKNATDYVSCAVNKTTETEAFNRISGYNNTKAIEAFNAAEENSAWPVDAVQKAVEFRAAVPAPGNSSGWYLPSIKELSLIVTGPYDGDIDDIFGDGANRDFLNSRLETLDGAVLLNKSTSYWSSTESSQYSSGSAYVMNFNYTYPTSGVTYRDTYSLRYVLAF